MPGWPGSRGWPSSGRCCPTGWCRRTAARLSRTTVDVGWSSPSTRTQSGGCSNSGMARPRFPADPYPSARSFREASVSGSFAPSTRIRLARACTYGGMARPRSPADSYAAARLFREASGPTWSVPSEKGRLGYSGTARSGWGVGEESSLIYTDLLVSIRPHTRHYESGHRLLQSIVVPLRVGTGRASRANTDPTTMAGMICAGSRAGEASRPIWASQATPSAKPRMAGPCGRRALPRTSADT